MANKMKTLSPILANYMEDGRKEIKEPLKFTDEELQKLTISLMGYPFIAFGNALLCPTCGVQQGVITNVAPDGEVNFYLNFRCRDYKDMENDKINSLGENDSTETPSTDTTEAQSPSEPQDTVAQEPQAVEDPQPVQQ